MIKALKNNHNRKGFTLAELLIVIAIIGVLVAVSIPIFSNQLKKARLAVNQANGRAAFSAAEAAYLITLLNMVL
ncbi:MAG: type IV pilin protein [Bilifractor sp.]